MWAMSAKRYAPHLSAILTGCSHGLKELNRTFGNYQTIIGIREGLLANKHLAHAAIVNQPRVGTGACDKDLWADA